MLDAAAGAVVIDDVQWLDDEALHLLSEVVTTKELLVSRRPWPITPAIRALDDALAARGDVERLGLLDLDDTAAAASEISGGPTSSKLVDRLHSVTAGSVGLLADALSVSWDGDLDGTPQPVIDAVMARVERAGPDALALVQLHALGPRLDWATLADALDHASDPDEAELAAKAGGLIGEDDHPIPLVERAVRRTLTARQRAALSDRLARVLVRPMPAAAMRHLIAGTGRLKDGPELLVEAASRLAVTEPVLCLELIAQAREQDLVAPALGLVEASAAFRAGRHDALGFQRLAPNSTSEDRAALSLIGFGTDVRDLRWQSASEREVPEEFQAPIRAFAEACIGTFPLKAIDPSGNEPTEAALVARLSAGLFAVVDGEVATGLGLLATAADDYDRQDWSLPLGITPHVLGATCSLWVGDVPAATGLLDQAVQLESGGPGEATTHRLLRAYARLLNGDYTDALDIVREGDSPTWPLRDRLLVAAIDAAIARRSGDTARLRDAWTRSEAVLLRPTGTWLFLDPVLELLAAGSRLEDGRRVGPVARALGDQLRALPEHGVGPASAEWLDLQLALAEQDQLTVQLAASRLEAIVSEALALGRPIDARVQARAAAAAVWSGIANGVADEKAATSAAKLLKDVGDGWEASRILGQTALDHPDAKAARRLLEAARSVITDVSDAESGEGLTTLGLSDREAEVAQLVSDGKTYKEVGAQLYISPKTVEHHVANVRQKLGASSRAEMIAIVRRAVQGK